jgi:uncharacterized protein YdeI (YjbR/CyaY-like superfamily)
MGKRDPRIDAYIAKQRDFAKPILTYLREVIHEGCPECDETLKWSSPTFVHHGLLCGFAGFKEHAIFGFWKHGLVLGPNANRERAAGSFGRLTSVADLPPKRVLLEWVRKARDLNESGVKVPRMRKGPKRAIPMPTDLKSALLKNKKAKSTFDAFSPSHQREYLEWIIGAKAEDTRKRRLDQAIEWMSEGKSRNWKYM